MELELVRDEHGRAALDALVRAPGHALPDVLVWPTWQYDGLCREADPEIFFPEQGVRPYDALALCDGCPVREPCLEYAVADPEIAGIWGGTTERERRTMRHQAA